MPEIAMQWQRFEELSTGRLYELLRFRQDIFVVEQRSPYPDLDGLDQGAWHLAARAGDELIGYLRVLPAEGPAGQVRIGRVAVGSRARRQGIGRVLMHGAVLFCRDRFPGQPIALGAQLHLAAFYRSFGFATASDPYDDFGVAHIDMVLRPPEEA
jgi:ElaA protein